jgi:transcription antitermination factor NusG
MNAGIEPGVRVRVAQGPFAGKVGVVQELDAKGGARVMLGLLAVRFELEHLTVHADRRVRPVLGTSHRKPVPARS